MRLINKIYDKEVFTVKTPSGSITLASVAIPLLLEFILNNVIGFISSAVLSSYSELAVAATGSANTIIGFISIVFLVIANGTSVLICAYIGANKFKDTGKICYISTIVNLFFAILISALTIIFASPILKMMNLEGLALEYGITFFIIRMAFFLIPALTSIFSAILRSFGHSKCTVVASLSTIVCNFLLNVYVIEFPQYSPLDEVPGVAAGCVLSQVLGLGITIYYLHKNKIKITIVKNIKELLNYAKQILNIGIPSGISGAAYGLSQLLVTSFLGLMGTFAVSAKVYYSNILIFGFAFSSCFGNANSLLIGRLIGAKEYEKASKLNRSLVKLTIAVNLTVSVIFVVFHKSIISIFTEDSKIIETALIIFAMDIIVEQARAVSHVYEYALKGAGDMKFMMIAVTVSCFVFGVATSYYLGIVCNMGLIGCWIGLTLDELVRTVASVYRWRSQKWQNKINL